MPNWCANSLKLIATTAESEAKLSEIVRELARAAAANDGAAIFALIKPIPEALNIAAGFGGDAAEQAEREALIALWRDAPGTKPTNSDGWHLYWDECWCWQEPPDGCVVPMTDFDLGEKVSLALARDAIVEWLHANGFTKVASDEETWTRETPMPHRKWLVRADTETTEVEGTGPTRLLALCAAARAVAGGEK